MKYRIDVIKKLLNAVYESELPHTTNIALMKVIEQEYSGYTFEYLIAYTKILSELGLMEADANNFGIDQCVSGEYGYFQTNVWLTYQGQEFIEKLNDATVWNKIKDNTQNATLGLLKALAPSLLSQYIMGL